MSRAHVNLVFFFPTCPLQYREGKKVRPRPNYNSVDLSEVEWEDHAETVSGERRERGAPAAFRPVTGPAAGPWALGSPHCPERGLCEPEPEADLQWVVLPMMENTTGSS